MWWRNTGITPYCYCTLIVVTMVTICFNVLVLWPESFQTLSMRSEKNTTVTCFKNSSGGHVMHNAPMHAHPLTLIQRQPMRVDICIMCYAVTRTIFLEACDCEGQVTDLRNDNNLGPSSSIWQRKVSRMYHQPEAESSPEARNPWPEMDVSQQLHLPSQWTVYTRTLRPHPIMHRPRTTFAVVPRTLQCLPRML